MSLVVPVGLSASSHRTGHLKADPKTGPGPPLSPALTIAC